MRMFNEENFPCGDITNASKKISEMTNEELFDIAYPVGSVFITKLKEQEFPYGEWEWEFMDVSGFHYFKRVK